MTSKTAWNAHSVIEHPLGTLGLVLIGLIAWGVEQRERRAWIGSLSGRLVLAGVAAVGWAMDRLPSRPAGRAGEAAGAAGNGTVRTAECA